MNRLMAFDTNGDLSDLVDKARVFVLVDDSIKPVAVRTTGIYSLKMYSNDFKIGDYVVGTCNNTNGDIIAVATPSKDTYNHDEIVGRIIGRQTHKIAKVLI